MLICCLFWVGCCGRSFVCYLLFGSVAGWCLVFVCVLEFVLVEWFLELLIRVLFVVWLILCLLFDVWLGCWLCEFDLRLGLVGLSLNF